MRSLAVLEECPDLNEYEQAHPASPIITVAGQAILAYARVLGIERRQEVPSDFDGSGETGLKEFLFQKGWEKQIHRGVVTAKKTFYLPPGQVTFDMGDGAHIWSYAYILQSAVAIEGRPVMHPEPLLEWYEAMQLASAKYPDQPRPSDAENIAFLREEVIPRIGEFSLYQAAKQ